MLAVVGAVSTCVYVYSLGYMDDGAGYRHQRRFFCFLDFFLASMALLVLAGNIAVLLVGWTGVGLASFLLISFWTERPGTLGAGLAGAGRQRHRRRRAAAGAGARPDRLRRPDTLGSTACVAGPGRRGRCWPR